MSDFWPDSNTTIEHHRWRRQAIEDMRQFATWLTIAALLIAAAMWITSDTEVFGAPTAPEAPVAAPEHHTGIWLTQGSTGDHVTETQTILAHHGWSLAVDGQYGPITQRIVTRFQQASGLLPDGVVGPVTWAALQSVAPGQDSAGIPTAEQDATASVPAPASSRWTGDIPEYGNRGRCTQAVADAITADFAAAGASRDTQEWSLLVASRETGCDHTKHVLDSDDDSFSIAMINAKSGIFGTKLKGWDRWRALDDFDYAVDMFVKLWEECGRGPWNFGNYYCRKPTS